jgi:hypothetical protein
MVDGKRDYLTVNRQGEVFAGWHGGPTRSESFVPLFFAMPGENFVDAAGTKVPYPDQLPVAVNRAFGDSKVSATVLAPGDGFTRNWQLAHFLKEIVREFRGE